MLRVEAAEKRSMRLGDLKLPKGKFPDIEERIALLADELDGVGSQRRARLHAALLKEIEEAPRESFLLPAVVDFASRVVESLDRGYTLPSFERWLLEQSGLDSGQQRLIRSKIVGRHIPREEYQNYFPIGLGRIHPGPHFITAHNPPDLDTAVASFWGWVDAFAAGVSEHGHQWNLPGGEPTTQISRLLDEIVGKSVVRVAARQSGHLAVTAGDLATRRGMEVHGAEALTTSIDHRRFEKCVILVDGQGYFLGTWRSSDVESFRTLVLLLTDCWRWFATSFHSHLVSLLTRDRVTYDDIAALVSMIFASHIKHCEVLKDVSEEQIASLDATLKKVLGVAEGVDATFTEFAAVLGESGVDPFSRLREVLGQLSDAVLYTKEGRLAENRPRLFSCIESISHELQGAVHAFRHHIDKLGLAMEIKTKVFEHPKQYVSVRADLDEVRQAIGPHHFLPVVESEGKHLILVGLISASDLQRGVLGTVTLRDFCNRDEVKIAPHLDIISVVDHHRSSLDTTSFPTAILGDVQSCNTLLAEQSMAVNDRYSLGGMTPEAAFEGCKAIGGDVARSRIAQRRLQRGIVASSRQDWFVHPQRELAEYLSYIYAILDDTDLLSRVTARDVLCVASLINRMKSLIEGAEVEVIHFDDLSRDENFPQVAAERILKNEEMYSLYSKIYAQREEEVESDLAACIEGRASSVFSDTKEQKGCARVGQTKLFPNNFASFKQCRDRLRCQWLQRVQEVYRNRPELQLHIQMVSTIAGAEEVYREGRSQQYSHEDEIWLWVPQEEEGYQRLASFLGNFRRAKEVQASTMRVKLLGSNAERLGEIISHHFGQQASLEAVESDLPIAVLKFRAGLITSRKTSITPYLPSA